MKKTIAGIAFALGIYVGVNVTLLAIKYAAEKARLETESKYETLVE